MSEWPKEHAWKACTGVTLSRVRIPPSPPLFSITPNLLSPHAAQPDGDILVVFNAEWAGRLNIVKWIITAASIAGGLAAHWHRRECTRKVSPSVDGFQQGNGRNGRYADNGGNRLVLLALSSFSARSRNPRLFS